MIRIVNTNSEKIDLTKVYSGEAPVNFKPYGLWYAINDDWIEWCKDNMNHWIKKYNLEITIDESRLLIIKTMPQLDRFRESFEVQSDYSRLIKEKEVNWRMVKERYTGIEIQNYHKLKGWGFNPMFDSMWFYAWDVSSGCIWDLSIIKEKEVKRNTIIKIENEN